MELHSKVGVGKSITANLAVTLAGVFSRILDADIYGPSANHV
jgi:Mrp family chromosome partitioning ATPase